MGVWECGRMGVIRSDLRYAHTPTLPSPASGYPPHSHTLQIHLICPDARLARAEQPLARVVAAQALQLLNQLPLTIGKVLRDHHLRPDVEIAVAAAAAGHSQAGETDLLPALDARAQGDPHRAGHGGDLDLGAERRFGEGDRELDVEVVALPLKYEVRLDLHLQEEVARRRAAAARRALPRHAQGLPLADAGRDGHRDAVRLLDLPAAMTRLARLVRHLAAPLALLADVAAKGE